MKSKMLRIGIPGRFFYPTPDRDPMLGPKIYTSIEQDMLDYISRSGAIPIMIPPMPDPMIMALVDDLDGLVLQGGSDVAPQSYGELPIIEDRWLGDAKRDAFELRLLEIAMDRGMPIFGICRGFQIMNVFFGGTLYQDLPTQVTGSILHRNIDKYGGHFHGVEFKGGGFFEKLHGSLSNAKVNSVHHQGIKELGNGLRPEAHCKEDGLIEGFVHEEGVEGAVVGVQWHPEFFHHYPGKLIQENILLNHWMEICRAKSILLEI